MHAPEAVAQLEDWFRKKGSVLVCYSGGVDSALVMLVAHRVLGARAVAMTAASPSLPSRELVEAKEVAHVAGVDHRVVRSDEVSQPEYRKNHTDRCFHCKSELYRIARAKAEEWELAAIVNGTNLDDLGDFRPGLEAAREAGVESPLVALGFTKADVRAAAEQLGLSVWQKPAAACLSSRIPFGTEVTEERLAQIGDLEGDLRDLGFRQVRVRYHTLGTVPGGTTERALARIELDPSEVVRASAPETAAAIVDAARARGFLYATLDLAGYRMGSHNEALREAPGPGAAGRRKLPLVGA